jgi:Ca2+-binding EF-hand superfamily protein
MNFRAIHCFGLGAASLAGLLFASAPAFAGGDKHHKGMAGMEMMDTNGDGQLSRDEHSAGARKMFETMDADKDGKVTATEMEAAHAQMAGKDMKKMKGHMSAAEKIKVVDTNGDGVLTAQEHATGATTMFDKMDTNKDGVLTKAEHQSGHKAMMKKAKDDTKDATKEATK